MLLYVLGVITVPVLFVIGVTVEALIARVTARRRRAAAERLCAQGIPWRSATVDRDMRSVPCDKPIRIVSSRGRALTHGG